MVLREWHRLPQRFPGIETVEFVVMPNHVHGIVRITPKAQVGLSDVVGAFKSRTTVAYAGGVQRDQWPRFDRRLWQRSYFDRVLRDEDELLRAERYIRMNPARWWYDPLNPRTGRPQGPPRQESP